jgi:hypothetical protein
MSKTRTSPHWYVLLAQVAIIAVLALRSSHLAAAEEDIDPPSRVARLSFVRGPVSFQPAGESEWVRAIANRPLTTGDRLWTDAADARAELTTGSVTVRLDASTDFAFINLDDRTVQMQLTQGVVTVRVQRLRRDEDVEVDTPNQAFSIFQPGSYRIEASEDGNSTLVTVRAGEGEASGGGDSYTVQAGQSTRFTGTDRLEATDLRLASLDELDGWGLARDRRAEASPSARYVSRDVVGYEDLDEYGTWRTDPSYGHVWIPTRTSSGWAPYREGHWAWISPWGYTWVDDAPWGYAPFHYGRWVTIQGRWGWVPGPVEVEAVYAPALVAFIGGPSFGVSLSVGGGGPRAEVGWFPLGPREVFVPGYHVSRGYVDRVNVSNTQVSTTAITNIFNNQTTNEYRVTNVTYVNRTVPGGVTVVPQQAFSSAQPVGRVAVKVDEQRIAAAPIGRTAAATPTQNAVFGTPKGDGAPRPPPAVTARSVVAKAPPPPPPVPFAVQQRALEAHPGQPLARQEVEHVRPAPAAAAQPLVRQAPPGKPATARGEQAKQPGPAKPAEQAAQPPAPKADERAAKQPAQAKPAEQAAQPPAPKADERTAKQPAQAKPAEQAAQPPAPKADERAAKQPAPAKPAEQVAQPPPPKADERAAKQPAPAKPAEQAAQPPPPKADERTAKQPAPTKPAEQVAQPPPPKADERAAKQPAPAKPAEQVARPPAPKAAERAAKEPAPTKPAEQAAQPPPPKADERAAKQPAPAKPAERGAQPADPSRQAQEAAPAPAPKAVARTPQRADRPPGAVPRPKRDEKGTGDGGPSPAEDRTTR